MILFLNFAPIQFMGGAEKWMNDTARELSKYTKTRLMSVHPSLSNMYGKVVLKRKFDDRSSGIKLHDQNHLFLSSFIPLSNRWKSARNMLQKSKLIYIRFEVLELFIILFFLGPRGLKKTIAGIHSPFIYKSPLTFTDKLHNAIYTSRFIKSVLKNMNKVHVLIERDANYFRKLGFANVIQVPNGAHKNNDNSSSHQRDLNIIFVGELSQRKGIDRLSEIVKSSPKNYFFTIVGDGYLKKEIENLSKENKNVTFLGHQTPSQIERLYKKNDALLLPSRAESLPLVILEALSHGLFVINSNETNIGIDSQIEFSSSTTSEYIATLNKVKRIKQSKKNYKEFIANYFAQNFSFEVVYPQLFSKLFNVKL